MSDARLERLRVQLPRLDSEQAISKLEEEIREITQKIEHINKPSLMLRIFGNAAALVVSLVIALMYGALTQILPCDDKDLVDWVAGLICAASGTAALIFLGITTGAILIFVSFLGHWVRNRQQLARMRYKIEIDAKALELREHYAVVVGEERAKGAKGARLNYETQE